MRGAISLILLALFRVASLQSPPSDADQHVLQSPVDPRVHVAYNQPIAGTCTTAYATQKQYTGYINLPPLTLAPIQQNYNINTFFWFIEARESPDTAPLTIWLSGGPGTSSMFGLFNEIGPCQVVQLADGTYGTQMRSFGWDRASNLLFIDQPNQVGFSYDVPTNASFDLFTDEIFEPPTPLGAGLPSFMYLNGTFGSASATESKPFASTANTTEIAAAATWHFLQTWLAAFPQYNPAVRLNDTSRQSSNHSVGVNLFVESYGGRYGPVFADYFDEQNRAITTGERKLSIRLESLGIINGLVDPLVQGVYYPTFAYNNSYGIKVISLTTELNALSIFSDQCAPAIQACRSAGTDIYGDNPNINSLCSAATATCNNLTVLASSSGYFPYDIRQKIPSPDPPAAYQEYLNYASVLRSIGAPVNYTENNNYVYEGFWDTGDFVRGDAISDLAKLLSQGVRVALIYGDADYICNWPGGQAVAYAIANASADHGADDYATRFATAGFADIVVNSTYVGGAVKQYGNLSFSRVYDSGHFVPFYQPATAFQIFARVIFGTDISTAATVDLSSFSSRGPPDSRHINLAPPPPAATCWVRSWNMSCSIDDTNAMLAGDGLAVNGIYYQDSSVTLPSSTVVAGVPGSPISTLSSNATSSSTGTSVALTGIYTATGTPLADKSTGVSSRTPCVHGCGGGFSARLLLPTVIGIMLSVST